MIEDFEDNNSRESIKYLFDHIYVFKKIIILFLLIPLAISFALVLYQYDKFVVVLGYIYNNNVSFFYSGYFNSVIIRAKLFCAVYLFVFLLIAPGLAYWWFQKGLAGNNRAIVGILAFSVMAQPLFFLPLIYVLSRFIGYETAFAHLEIANRLAFSVSLFLSIILTYYFMAVYGARKTLRYLYSILMVVQVIIVWLWPFWFIALTSFVIMLYFLVYYLKFIKEAMEFERTNT